MSAAVEITPAADALSPAEFLNGLPENDLLAAATETSPVYDGLVLREAVRIVCWRTRLNPLRLSKRLEMGKNAFYRWSAGEPVRNHKRFNRALRDLALVLEDAREGEK